MTHLMRLELKKVGLKKYVIFSMIGIFISMYFLFVGLNDSSTIKSNYETAFSTVGMIFCVYYITLFSVLVATYIINEYNHKTILVMFSYPIDRRKLMIAKLLLITLLVMFSMIVGYNSASSNVWKGAFNAESRSPSSRISAEPPDSFTSSL